MLYTSKDNKKIKDIKKLQSKKYRDLTNRYIIEGEHLVNEAFKEGYLDEIYAKSIILTNENGGMVKLKVGKDGKIDISETFCDVFVYPNECLVREYLYRSDDIVANFAGLTPDQTLLNFVPFIGWKRSEFNG